MVQCRMYVDLYLGVFYRLHWYEIRRQAIRRNQRIKEWSGALHASLPVKPAGWSIGIGDKFKNHDLLERQVTINIRNTGQMPLIHHLHIAPYDYTRFEELKIEPGNQVTAFKGTMGTFWRNLSTLSLYALSGSKMSFMIIVEFGDDVSTCNPIEIEAHYRDSF